MRSIALSICMAFSTIIYSQINIIPQPVEIKPGKGSLSIKQPIVFIYNSNIPGDDVASFFKDYLKRFYNVTNFKTGTEHSDSLPTEIFVDYAENYQPKEGYELTVDKKGITMKGSKTGLFYAFQTLIQMLPPHISNNLIQLPFVTIKDYPRFEYRGLHLDVGRHFMPVDFIKKYIDYIALHKMNYFHWGLTQDQGWRIEIKRYPELTKTGAYRNGTIIGRYPGTGNDNIKYGGFYTQEQVKEIVRYAADRYITIIPEINYPGHSSAAIAAYPWLSCFPNEPTKIPANMISEASKKAKGKLVQETWGVFEDVFCAGKDSTFQFLENVYEEFLSLFPSKYIHVGGDECPKANWKKCPRCQQRMKENNLKDEHELQSYFIQRMEKYLNSKGRTLIGWDEILEGGLAPNAIVMSWRGETGGIEAAKQKHQVIMTPSNPVYFDHSQSENEDSVTIGGYNPIEKVYAYEPIPAALNDEQGKYVLGAQANLWTEYITNPRKVEYMLFPRLAALSEVLWSQKENKNWTDFEKRLQVQFKRYDMWKVNYSRAYFELRSSVLPTENFSGVLWKLESKNPAAEIRTISHYAGRPYELKFSEGVKYSSPILIKSSQLVAAISMVNGKAFSDPVSQTLFFNKATGKKITLITPPSNSYKGDGAFTLVNGVQNEKGRARSKEFLGFSGTDCEAIIDLGKEEKISTVIIHALSDKGSWIYQPLAAEALISSDGKNFTSDGITDDFKITKNMNGIMKINLETESPVRYVKVVIKNWGDIPAGDPGAGNKAWIFVDEIEIN